MPEALDEASLDDLRTLFVQGVDRLEVLLERRMEAVGHSRGHFDERTAGSPCHVGPSLDLACRAVARDLLLDGHSLAFRAWFALQEAQLSTASGQETQAVFGFASMLAKLLEDQSPTGMAVAFDRREPTFRDALAATYKAGRPVTPPAARRADRADPQARRDARRAGDRRRGLRGRRRDRDSRDDDSPPRVTRS